MALLPRRKSSAAALASALLLVGLSVGTTTAPAAARSRQAATDGCSAPVCVAVASGVPYGDGPSQTLDAYWSTVATGQPSIILIHGGGWSAGSSADYSSQAVYLAQNGFAVFSINYTLSSPGDPTWPQVLTDVETATRWVRDNAATYGADGSRIGAYGGSAGGHLAALLDVAGGEGGIPIRAAVSWSGPMDLPLTYRDGNEYVRDMISQLLGCVPGSCSGGEEVAASPTSHISSDDGALLFFNAKEELVPIRQAHAMDRALRAAAVPHDLVVFADTHGHASELECHPQHVLGVRQPAIDGAIRWLGKYLTGRPYIPTGTFCG